jgi:hypothetical protein
MTRTIGSGMTFACPVQVFTRTAIRVWWLLKVWTRSTSVLQRPLMADFVEKVT